MINKKFSVVILFLLVLILIGLFIYQNKKKNDANEINNNSVSSTNLSNNLDIAGESKKWRDRLDKEGAEVTYRQFKAETSKVNYNHQHTLAHIFGNILFNKLGINAIKVCDDSFSDGCYHSVITRVIAADGVGIVPKIDEICLKKDTIAAVSCQHGIGHGLVVFLGYTKEKFEKALQLCDTTKNLGLYPSCEIGAFMEYNTPIDSISGIARIDIARKLDINNPDKLCQEIGNKYQKICNATISYWWYMVLRDDFKKIGSLCQGITNIGNRRICFYGIGITLATVSYNVSDIKTRCKLLIGDQSEALCLTGAAFGVKSALVNLQAESICEDLKDSLKKNCIENDPKSFFKVQ